MTVSRRSILALGGLAAASLAAGCSHAVRDSRTRSGASAPSGPVSAPGTETPSTSPGSAGPATTPAGTARTTAPATAHRGPAQQFAHGPRSRREVALTFHGAGDPAIARDLLAIFAAHHAKVTVLGVGTWLATNHALAREIVRGGHELGNHTYSHLDIDSLDAATARQEIVRCRDLLVSLVGSGGAHFRQSQSQTASALVRKLAGAAGYPVCLSYDVDSLDFTDPGPDAVRANLRAARPGSIVSMHFGHPGTVTAMPHILDDLAARGLQPVTAATLLRA